MSTHQFITNIKSGNYVIETATVTMNNDKIIKVELSSDGYHPVSIDVINNTKNFWRDEYARINMTMSEQELISRLIGMNLCHKNDTHIDEDSWIDAAYEDRFADAPFEL